jgi:succinyl-diaminopimelate desuccinylase
LIAEGCRGSVLDRTAPSVSRYFRKWYKMSETNLQLLVQTYRSDLVGFARRLIQTPSLPGHEGEAASLIKAEMERLDFDQVTTDQVGNVIGWVRKGDGPSLMFNGHMDHVDPGDPAGWLHPPYAGGLDQEELWGRGSVDMKGPLAAMVYAAGLAKQHNLLPPGDVCVACAVMEEVGGLGTRALVSRLKPSFAVVGEPSNGGLMRGHRGRVELAARVDGRSVHASVPEQGINPHYALARFLGRLETLPMTRDPVFGTSSVAPTLYRTDQTSANVTPGEAQLTLDWRNVPGETPEQIVERLTPLLAECLSPGAGSHIWVKSERLTTYTGHMEDFPSIFPFFALPVDHPLLWAAQRILGETLGRPVPVGIWHFATDGGHLMAAGVPTIGFGPGDPALAHTNRERLPVDALVEGLVGYMALATGLGRMAGLA